MRLKRISRQFYLTAVSANLALVTWQDQLYFQFYKCCCLLVHHPDIYGDLREAINLMKTAAAKMYKSYLLLLKYIFTEICLQKLAQY